MFFSMSSFDLINAHDVVAISNSLINFFSVCLFCTILIIFGLGSTFFVLEIFSKVLKGIFSNSKVIISTCSKKDLISSKFS